MRLMPALTLCAAVACVADVARGEDAELAPPVSAATAGGELGASLVYGSPPVRGGTTPFGAGAGGRLALVVGRLSLGAAVTYFLGGSEGDVSNYAVIYGVEIGYDLPLLRAGNVTISLRPLIGAGGLRVFHVDPSLAKVDVVTRASGQSSSTSSDTVSVDAAYVEPALALVLARRWQLLSLTASSLVVPSMVYDGGDEVTWVSCALRLGWGARF